MSNVIPLHQPKVEHVTEASFEHLTNDQLIYRAASACDLAEAVLFDEENGLDDLGDARWEVLMAGLALRVLLKRVTGCSFDDLKAREIAAFRERVFGKQDGPEV